jgi:cytochrome c-type biogenesis protein CcmH
LLRRYEAAQDDTEQLNVGIAREHLAELTKQRDLGELSDEEFEQARKDLEIALANDLAGTADQSTRAARGGGWLALVASVVLIPALAVSMYLEIGSPDLITAPPRTQVAAGHGGDLPPITELAATLRERLEEDPDNAEGWFLLGRTYMRIQDYPRAADAFGRVVALLPEEPAALLSLADALTMRDGMRTGPEALALLEKAVEIQPESVTALWMLGNAAYDADDAAKAVEYWTRAYPLLAGEPQMQAELGQRIAAAGGTVPESPATLPPIMPTASPPPAATPAPAAGSSPAPDPAAEGGAAIDVEVALSPALLDRAAPGDTVFVLARAESGPPMPLAVARHTVAELPLAVTLTDAMAMMPAMKLSSFPRVRVTAKISKSGNAATQAGDLLAADVIVDTDSPPATVQLLINDVAGAP